MNLPTEPLCSSDSNYAIHRHWMSRAVELARAAGDAGEVPVGAVIVDGAGKLIAEAQNRRERDCDPTAHAEVLALRAAGKVLQDWHLNQCTLYVTLEPCPMCAGAIVQARIGLLVYGADDPKTGTCHRLQVLGGIMESVCRDQLLAWFEARRQI
ncbi:MAG: nucleoside deaminase [Oscillatoriales cyanobacterium]|nr:MAG: nucleoside deaminase [Oscillatoriales cyanobacterium]